MSPVVQDIEWNPRPVLNPGLDFQNGITYISIPVMRNKLIPPKKKGMDPTIVKGYDMLVISNDRDENGEARRFFFDAEGVEENGFTLPPHSFVERESRWSMASAKAFVSNSTIPPQSTILFRRIHEVYTTFVEFANEQYFTIMPLFIMYSYVFRLFDTTGYMHFNGTAASGKSRNLNIINALAFNPMMASSMSASSVFRKIAGAPGVLCIDESENFDGERGQELRNILLGGYMRSGKATRSEKGPNDKWESIDYATFGPKALASINILDSTFASRCLIVEMRPAIREIPDFPIEVGIEQWQEIRDQLYLWTMENTAGISKLAIEWSGTRKAKYAPNLMSRAWEICKPLVVMADYIGGEEMVLPLVSFFNEYFNKQQAALDATDRLRTTLRALPRVLATKAAHPGFFYSSKDIYDVIGQYMEEDAKEYFKTRHVGKNLDVLGFKEKRRATGGMQYKLTDQTVRNELTQRRVQPMDEDLPWMKGDVDYQSAASQHGINTPAHSDLADIWGDNPFGEDQ